MACKTKFLIAICWLVGHIVKAQTNQLMSARNRFALHVGLNYSITTIHQPGPIRLRGLNNKVGYYLEGSYCRQWSTGLMFQVAASYQQKGVSAANPNNLSSINASYTYLSLTPCIGFELFHNVSLMGGTQISRLVGTQHALGNAKLVEFGLVAKIAYQVKEIQVDVGYFGGLAAYDHLDPIGASLYNQSWSIGLSRYIR